MVIKRRIVRNEFGGFSPIDEFGNVLPQSVPGPIMSAPKGEVNQFGDILQSTTTPNKPTTEDIQDTKKELKAISPEPMKVEKIRVGSRPKGVTLTPSQEFDAAEQERRIIMEGGRKVKNINPADIQALAERQAQPLDLGVTMQPEVLKSQADRNAAAGVASYNAFLENFGLSKNVDPSKAVKGMNPFAKTLFGGIGLATATSIAGVSVSTLFSARQRNIDNLLSDVKQQKGELKDTARFATSKGADLGSAIAHVSLLEDSIRFKYNEAMMGLRANPRDIQSGLDMVEDMSRDLNYAKLTREALERFQLTGDPRETLFLVGTDLTDTNQ